MMELLTSEAEQSIRAKAKRIDSDNGEDAFHDAVHDFLLHPPTMPIRDIVGFFVKAIHFRVLKYYRTQAQHVKACALLADEDAVIPTLAGLQHRWDKPHTRCAKDLHSLEDVANVAYIGGRRTCRKCKQARENAYRKERREKLRVVCRVTT